MSDFPRINPAPSYLPVNEVPADQPSLYREERPVGDQPRHHSQPNSGQGSPSQSQSSESNSWEDLMETLRQNQQTEVLEHFYAKRHQIQRERNRQTSAEYIKHITEIQQEMVEEYIENREEAEDQSFLYSKRIQQISREHISKLMDRKVLLKAQEKEEITDQEQAEKAGDATEEKLRSPMLRRETRQLIQQRQQSTAQDYMASQETPEPTTDEGPATNSASLLDKAVNKLKKRLGQQAGNQISAQEQLLATPTFGEIWEPPVSHRPTRDDGMIKPNLADLRQSINQNRELAQAQKESRYLPLEESHIVSFLTEKGINPSYALVQTIKAASHQLQDSSEYFMKGLEMLLFSGAEVDQSSLAFMAKQFRTWVTYKRMVTLSRTLQFLSYKRYEAAVGKQPQSAPPPAAKGTYEPINEGDALLQQTFQVFSPKTPASSTAPTGPLYQSLGLENLSQTRLPETSDSSESMETQSTETLELVPDHSPNSPKPVFVPKETVENAPPVKGAPMGDSPKPLRSTDKPEHRLEPTSQSETAFTPHTPEQPSQKTVTSPQPSASLSAKATQAVVQTSLPKLSATQTFYLNQVLQQAPLNTHPDLTELFQWASHFDMTTELAPTFLNMVQTNATYLFSRLPLLIAMFRDVNQQLNDLGRPLASLHPQEKQRLCQEFLQQMAEPSPPPAMQPNQSSWISRAQIQPPTPQTIQQWQQQAPQSLKGFDCLQQVLQQLDTDTLWSKQAGTVFQQPPEVLAPRLQQFAVLLPPILEHLQLNPATLMQLGPRVQKKISQELFTYLQTGEHKETLRQTVLQLFQEPAMQREPEQMIQDRLRQAGLPLVEPAMLKHIALLTAGSPDHIDAAALLLHAQHPVLPETIQVVQQYISRIPPQQRFQSISEILRHLSPELVKLINDQLQQRPMGTAKALPVGTESDEGRELPPPVEMPEEDEQNPFLPGKSARQGQELRKLGIKTPVTQPLLSAWNYVKTTPVATPEQIRQVNATLCQPANPRAWFAPLADGLRKLLAFVEYQVRTSGQQPVVVFLQKYLAVLQQHFQQLQHFFSPTQDELAQWLHTLPKQFTTIENSLNQELKQLETEMNQLFGLSPEADDTEQGWLGRVQSNVHAVLKWLQQVGGSGAGDLGALESQLMHQFNHLRRSLAGQTQLLSDPTLFMPTPAEGPELQVYLQRFGLQVSHPQQLAHIQQQASQSPEHLDAMVMLMQQQMPLLPPVIQRVAQYIKQIPAGERFKSSSEVLKFLSDELIALIDQEDAHTPQTSAMGRHVGRTSPKEERASFLFNGSPGQSDSHTGQTTVPKHLSTTSTPDLPELQAYLQRFGLQVSHPQQLAHIQQQAGQSPEHLDAMVMLMQQQMPLLPPVIQRVAQYIKQIPAGERFKSSSEVLKFLSDELIALIDQEEAHTPQTSAMGHRITPSKESPGRFLHLAGNSQPETWQGLLQQRLGVPKPELFLKLSQQLAHTTPQAQEGFHQLVQVFAQLIKGLPANQLQQVLFHLNQLPLPELTHRLEHLKQILSAVLPTLSPTTHLLSPALQKEIFQAMFLLLKAPTHEKMLRKVLGKIPSRSSESDKPNELPAMPALAQPVSQAPAKISQALLPLFIQGCNYPVELLVQEREPAEDDKGQKSQDEVHLTIQTHTLGTCMVGLSLVGQKRLQVKLGVPNAQVQRFVQPYLEGFQQKLAHLPWEIDTVSTYVLPSEPPAANLIARQLYRRYSRQAISSL